LAPVNALSAGFRRRFLRLARRALSKQTDIPYVPKQKRLVVYTKPVICGAERVLDYLGHRVQKTAITDSALLASTHESVTFRYRDSRDHTSKVMTLPGNEFLRRFLQHALPRGLHRTRALGLLAPAQRRLQLLLGAPPAPSAASAAESASRTATCSCCGGVTRRGSRLSPEACAAVSLMLSHLARAPPHPEVPV
jgi:hypothetical protein